MNQKTIWRASLRIRYQKDGFRLPVVAQQKQIRLVTMRLQVLSLASLSGLRIGVAMICGVGGRCSSDPALLWLWHRPAAAALIHP